MSQLDQHLSILVTGGAGYIGSRTVRMLRSLGHAPIVLDTLENGYPEAVEDSPLVVGSVEDRHLVREVLQAHAIRAVIHFAALKSAPESLEDPAGYLSRNVGGALALLSEVDRAGIEAFVFSSSCAVYGAPARSPVVETAEVSPTTPYGASKLLVERALPWYERRGLRHASLRYFNAAGADHDAKHGEGRVGSTSLVPRVVAAALGRQPALVVYGSDYDTPDGTAIRDYIHVTDLASAHVRAVESLLAGRPSFTVNLGTGRGTSVLEVVAAVERAAGRPVPVELAPRREGDPPAIWADATLARSTLGWQAVATIDDIAESSLGWHLLHPDGYASVAGAPPAGPIGTDDWDGPAASGT
jgi:UDP-glucose-4-epimerase GalE